MGTCMSDTCEQARPEAAAPETHTLATVDEGVSRKSAGWGDKESERSDSAGVRGTGKSLIEKRTPRETAEPAVSAMHSRDMDAALLAELDADGDGVISKAEFDGAWCILLNSGIPESDSDSVIRHICQVERRVVEEEQAAMEALPPGPEKEEAIATLEARWASLLEHEAQLPPVPPQVQAVLQNVQKEEATEEETGLESEWFRIDKDCQVDTRDANALVLHILEQAKYAIDADQASVDLLPDGPERDDALDQLHQRRLDLVTEAHYDHAPREGNAAEEEERRGDHGYSSDESDSHELHWAPSGTGNQLSTLALPGASTEQA